MLSYLLHDFIVKKHIKRALEEDICYGDISTDYVDAAESTFTAVMNSREEGIVCGVDVAKMVFQILDKRIVVDALVEDGDHISKGQDIAIIKGNARAILTGERTALNYIQRMSAIATLTHRYVEELKDFKAQIVETRKTTPGFRIFEKYSVKIGGGATHRFGLSDCVMLKDNHIALCGGIKEAVEKVRKHISYTHKIEVETDTLKQVQEAIEAGADIIMLDNMSIEEMTKAVKLINHKAIVEASGNVKLKNLKEIAATGVDFISTSATIVKAGTLDIGLDIY